MHLGKDNLFACLRVGLHCLRFAASLAGVVMCYSVLPRRARLDFPQLPLDFS